MLKKIIGIFVIITFYITGLYGSYYGYIKGGAEFSKPDNDDGELIPYMEFYTFNDSRQGPVTRAKLIYKYDKEDKEFDAYTINSFYVYMDNYNVQKKKTWYIHLGDDTYSYTPVTLWASDLKGINGGVNLLLDDKSLINSVSIMGFLGFTKEKIKGYKAAPTEDSSLNKDGQFQQNNYGGGISCNISKKFKVEQLYALFNDNKNSLKSNENYLATPLKNQIIGTKVGYYTRETRVYLNYALSTYDSDIFDNSNKELKGSAVYLEGEHAFTSDFRFIGKVYYINEEYFSTAVSEFENDMMKFYLGYDWKIKSFDIYHNGYYKKNNLAGKPIEEVLTTKEMGTRLNGTYNYSKDISFTLRTRLVQAKTEKEVNENKDDWVMYEGGVDVTKMFYFGSVFKYLQITLTGTYNKKDNNSIVSGTESDDENSINGGIISALDLFRIENNLDFMVYQLKTGDVKENIISIGEKFTYRIKPEKWKSYLQYNIAADSQSGTKIYTKNTIWYGNEVYLVYNQSIKADIGYEDYNMYEGDDSYKQFMSKLEYKYVF